jgi:hypothetical protein
VPLLLNHDRVVHIQVLHTSSERSVVPAFSECDSVMPRKGDSGHESRIIVLYQEINSGQYEN